MSRSRNPMSADAEWCWWPVSAACACARAVSSSRGEMKARSNTAIRTIMTRPPRYSARVNCQPISTHSTRPSSHTRLVDANWNAIAADADAPFWNRLLAIAIAA